jgi:shikimate kinase
MTFDKKNIPEVAILRDALVKPVVLIGLMGSGKSRLGRKVASILSIDFYDSDRVIEEKAGRTVSEIFSNDGEEKFRAVEKKTILELLEKGLCVIASGGGSVINEGVIQTLKQRAVTIWLKADPEELVKRLEYAHDRPLLKSGKPEDVLRSLAEKRAHLYAQADIVIETNNLSSDQATTKLIKGLYAFLKPANL